MPASNVLSGVWPRALALALLALSVAGCSNSGRFDVQNPFDSPKTSARPSQDVTGSVSSTPAHTNKISSQPLPAPSKPQTVAASGVAQGAGGMGAYRPSTSSGPDITGSVNTPHPAAPTGHWSWEGGTPITVGAGDTPETIGRKYGVPASAIMQANGITSPADLKPGQRIVIPRYTVASAPSPAPQHVAPPPQTIPTPAPVAATRPAQTAETLHIVAPGESLIGISRKYGVPLTTLAKANKIEPYHKVAMGERITIPGHHAQPQPQQKQAAAPRIEKPQVAPPQTVASIPPQQNARVATPEPAAHDTPVKSAEPAGAMPSFRWPVHGRVISQFGAKTNGQSNDGINVAVPEGTPVKATEDGVVAYAGNELKGYGNLVLVRHSNGYVSAYAHASEILVKRGDTIKRGQTIARAGQTGNVTSPQLHFEIRKGSTPVDPTQYLAGNNANAQ
jgi:murein DD-endopeptidase MepM/ murein hydrolase activator NlpD